MGVRRIRNLVGGNRGRRWLKEGDGGGGAAQNCEDGGEVGLNDGI